MSWACLSWGLTAPEFRFDSEKSKYKEDRFILGVIVMLTQLELEQLVRRTVALYNRFRSPEAFAKVVFVSPDLVTISFSGSFCYSCGVFDYIEDFVHEFKILTSKAELKVDRSRQTSPRSFEADYKVKNLS